MGLMIDKALRIGFAASGKPAPTRRSDMQQAAVRIQEVNPARLAMLYRKEFELCRVKSVSA